MNKFTQHIPNYCDGFERRVFEFSDLDDLASKLGGYARSLVYDDGHLLSLSKGGTEWRVIGRVDNPVEGLAKWRGGRVAECTGLENRRSVTTTGGSNPPLSAFYFIPSGFKGRTILVTEDPYEGAICRTISDKEKEKLMIQLGVDK